MAWIGAAVVVGAGAAGAAAGVARYRHHRPVAPAQSSAGSPDLDFLGRALATVERQAALLTEFSPDGVVVSDGAGLIVYANPAAHQLVGAATPGSLIGCDARILIAPEDLATAKARSDAALAGTVTASTYESLVHVDGGLVPVETKSVPYEHQGAPAVLSLIRDVTARRVAEKALTESETRQRTTLEAIGEGVILYRVEPDGSYVQELVNPAASRILGVGLTSDRHLHVLADFPIVGHDGEPLAAEDTPVATTARTGAAVAGFIVGLAFDSGTRWLRATSQPILNDAGVVARIAVSLVDVTAEHEARREIEAARARLSALVEYGSDVITVLADHGIVTYASPAYKAVFGLDPVGQVSRILSASHPGDRQRIVEAYRALIATPGAVNTIDARIMDRLGRWRHFEITAANRLDDPAVEGVVTTSRDITDRVEAVDRLSWEAGHDDLTGLANRGLFLRRLATSVAAAGRSGDPCALLFLDLDGFKTVNDSRGHATGDHVLVVTANRLRAALRPGDSVARLGGDEFVLVAQVVRGDAVALEIAERIHLAIVAPMTLDDEEITIGCSIGVAVSRGQGTETLLKEADEALYLAKADGRSCCRLYGSAPKDL